MDKEYIETPCTIFETYESELFTMKSFKKINVKLITVSPT